MVSIWRLILSLFGAVKREESRTDTEFTAEVVRVTEVLPHPNADRLEIARFELRGSGPSAYDVVIGKGEFRPGDLAAYLSVDCLLPLSRPEFAFLKERPDGKNKDVFRLRAARLRGVFSQGLLVKPPVDDYGIGFEFGRSVAEHLGVGYHRGPEDSTPGPTPATAKRKPQPWPVYGVDSLKKLPRLFQEGEDVLITEKIHGANMRFGWVRRRFMGIPYGWTFKVGSHRAMKGGEAKGAGYYGTDVWAELAARFDLAERTRDYKGYLFVGEIFGPGIQDLTYGRKETDFVLFDVRNPKGKWLTDKERLVVAADTLLNEVPCLYSGPFTASLLDMAEGPSTFPGAVHVREGIVVESADRSKKAKFVGQGYLLRKGA